MAVQFKFLFDDIPAPELLGLGVYKLCSYITYNGSTGLSYDDHEVTYNYPKELTTGIFVLIPDGYIGLVISSSRIHITQTMDVIPSGTYTEVKVRRDTYDSRVGLCKGDMIDKLVIVGTLQ